jgi:dihydrofolate reductase
MPKLILWDMVSLDGFFEGPNKGDIEWFVFDDELEKYVLETQSDVGSLVFGRTTYELMAAYWPSAQGQIADFMNSVPKLVFSTTLQGVDWNNSRLVKSNVREEVSRLKQSAGGDIFCFGSADFAATLINEGLVDEYRLGINPVLLGSGVPFFKGSDRRRKLKLIDTRPLKSGLVILHYQPE